jgi:FAD/FMN-containing dehydrogenase
VAWGKTVDNVRDLTVVSYGGTQLTVGPTGPDELTARARQRGETGGIYRGLAQLSERHAALVRTQTPRLTRRVSGYNLDQLLPENGFNLARALVGTEGSCVTMLEATVDLVPMPAARVLTVVGYPGAFGAADAAPGFLDLAPLTIEGMDVALIAALRAARPADQRYKLLPDGEGWLFIETGGATGTEAEAAAQAVAARAAQTGGPAGSSPTRPRCGPCGASGRPGRGSSPVARTAGRPGPAGRTPRCRPSSSGRICGSSAS